MFLPLLHYIVYSTSPQWLAMFSKICYNASMKTHCINQHEYTEENTVYRGKEGLDRRRYCRTCLSDRYKRWYDKNQPAQVARVAKYNKDNAEKIRLVLRARYKRYKQTLVNEAGGKCERCSYSEHLAALDFDHLDPSTKKEGIGRVLAGGRSLAAAREEAKKCRLLCANCHRIWTFDPEAFAKKP
jgi:hypothetical protein